MTDQGYAALQTCADESRRTFVSIPAAINA